MMKNVLVVGATGGLGKRTLKELKNKGYFIRALVKDKDSAKSIKNIADEIVVGDASDAKSLDHLCKNIDIVFSALGKSVSLFSKDDKTFFEVDYIANKNILDQAKLNGVNRFVYISIYGSDIYRDFELAKVHRDIEKELSRSGINHTIIRPVGIFIGLLDVLRMAKNGVVVTVGDGESKTNPIHEDDLAIVCADNIEEGSTVIEVGGPIIYTRNQIAELAIKSAQNRAQHIHLFESIVQAGLPLFQFYDQAFFDKLAFFNNVLTHNVVAPKFGTNKLEDYFDKHVDRLEESLLDLVW